VVVATKCNGVVANSVQHSATYTNDCSGTQRNAIAQQRNAMECNNVIQRSGAR